MWAEFGAERELHSKLFYKECENDDGNFHFHSQIEICIVDEGEMDILINEKRTILQKDEMCISLSYDAHIYRPISYSKSIVLVLPNDMCRAFIESVKDKRVVNPFIRDHALVRKIRSFFYEIKKNPLNHIKQLGYVNLILGFLSEALTFAPTGEKVESDLSSRILFYIRENFKNELTLSSLSAAFGYSTGYISRYFKTSFNIGFHQYLNTIRLKNAILLLGGGQHSITTCALESGFTSLRTFYRVFQETFHITPRAYIETIKAP